MKKKRTPKAETKHQKTAKKRAKPRRAKSSGKKRRTSKVKMTKFSASPFTNGHKAIMHRVDGDLTFKLASGQEISNLFEFAEHLDTMGDDTFNHHANQERNDFSNWIREVFKLEELADTMQQAQSRAEAHYELCKYLIKELAR